MKRFTIPAFILFVAACSQVSADLAPRPSFKNFVTMKEADVKILLKQTDDGILATVDAEFDMYTDKSIKNAVRKTPVSFPVAPRYQGADVRSFSVSVDGVDQDVSPYGPRDHQGKVRLIKGYQWDCPFKVGETTKVKVSYTMVLPDAKGNQKLLFYSLTSGSEWAGKIALETVTITADKQLSMSPKASKLNHQKTQAGTLLYTVRKSDPQEDILVYVAKADDNV